MYSNEVAIRNKLIQTIALFEFALYLRNVSTKWMLSAPSYRKNIPLSAFLSFLSSMTLSPCDPGSSFDFELPF